MKKVVVLAAALSAVAFGCSSDSYSRDDAIKDLMEEGDFTREQAECVVDGAEKEFGIETLNSKRDPTAEEEEAMMAITFECMGLGDLVGGDDSEE